MTTNEFKAYSSATFWKIKPGALVADLVLIGISIFFSHSLSEYVATATQESSSVLQILILFAQFTLPWYLGYLYGKCLIFYGRLLRTLVLIVSCLVCVAFIGSVTVFLTGLPKFGEMSGANNFVFFAMFWVFAIIAGPFLALSGKSTGKGSFVKLEKGENNGSFFQIVFICLFIVAFIIGLFILMYYLGNGLGIFASAILLGLLVYIAYTLYQKLKDNYIVKLVETIAVRAFPLIVLLSLTVWSFVSVQTSLADNLGNRFGFRQIIYILLLNGFIPLRIIQMFDPPLSIVNLILSIASLVIFLSLIH